MKVKHFTMQNVKGVNTFDYEFPQDGVVVLGGRNNQGKTSVLDGIAYTLGGEKMRPSNYKKVDVEGEPYMRCEFDNGIVAERVGEGADLRVTDETGARKGQKLLDTFIETFALNVPKFLNGSEKERNAALLQTIGIGDQLEQIDAEETTEYDERTIIGRIADQKKKAVKEMPFYPDMPEREISPSEVMAKIQEIHVRNASIVSAQREIEQNKKTLEGLVSNSDVLAAQKESVCKDADTKIETVRKNAESRREQIAAQMAALKHELESLGDESEKFITQINDSKSKQLESIDVQIASNETAIADMLAKIESAEKQEFVTEDTSALEKELSALEETNAKIRANIERAEKQRDADDSQRKYDEKTEKIEELRRRRDALLEGADLPYPGLSYYNKHIYLDGKAWDCISESKKYIVACAIVMRINPHCKFILMDKLEQMDSDTLKEFDEWVTSKGLQVIATRVTSNADECTIVIHNGYIEGMEGSIIVPHKIRKNGKKSKDGAEQTQVAEDNPVKELLTHEISQEREDAITEDTMAMIEKSNDAVARARQLLLKRRGEILSYLGDKQ